MNLTISASLDYFFAKPTDVLLQLEAAELTDQTVVEATLDIPGCDPLARTLGHDGIGERIWLRAAGPLTIAYTATVAISRPLVDCVALPAVAPRDLPGHTVQYLFPSRYCQSDLFEPFVKRAFAGLTGGALVLGIRDWIAAHFAYVPGASDSTTTARDSFVRREGVCRDYAHMLIALARAADIPARIASVYATGVDPPDFHAVAEVYLGGAWHLIDATGMAHAGAMARIGVGRDAADVAFLTAFGEAELRAQSVVVT